MNNLLILLTFMKYILFISVNQISTLESHSSLIYAYVINSLVSIN